MTSELIDSFGRRIDYLRLSVIEQCNFRCFYCMPEQRKCSASRKNWLTPGQIAQLTSAFASLGISKVRITGGEPLLRKDLVSIVERVAAIDGISDISLSSNGYLLPKYADELAAAGVGRVNISLDSLEAGNFADITGRTALGSVLRGVDAALAAGMSPIKINMVVLRGINDREIPQMVEYALQHNLNLRFIEAMPLGSQGADLMDHHMPAHAILERIKNHFGRDLVPVHEVSGGGPARYYQVAGSEATVGVISAVSRHFCATCNRLRVSVSGDLQLCLGDSNRVSLAHLLKDDVDEADLIAAIRQAVAKKPLSHHFDDTGAGHREVDMASIGG